MAFRPHVPQCGRRSRLSATRFDKDSHAESEKDFRRVDVAVAASTAAFAQEPLKTGMVTTPSEPGGYLGQDIRGAFQLAIDLEGGKLKKWVRVRLNA
jgi:hypothetical protein